MAEYMATQISIGGELPSGRIEEFFDAVEAQGVGFEWEEHSVGSSLELYSASRGVMFRGKPRPSGRGS